MPPPPVLRKPLLTRHSRSGRRALEQAFCDLWKCTRKKIFPRRAPFLHIEVKCPVLESEISTLLLNQNDLRVSAGRPVAIDLLCSVSGCLFTCPARGDSCRKFFIAAKFSTIAASSPAALRVTKFWRKPRNMLARRITSRKSLPKSLRSSAPRFASAGPARSRRLARSRKRTRPAAPAPPRNCPLNGLPQGAAVSCAVQFCTICQMSPAFSLLFRLTPRAPARSILRTSHSHS